MAEKEVEDTVLACLKRIEEKVAILAKAKLAPILKAELGDTKMAKLYELTGKVSCNNLARTLSFSPKTIVKAWKRWEGLGLLIKDGRQYRKVLE